MIDFVSFSAGAWAVCGGLPQWVFDTAIRGSQTHHCFILNTTNEKYVGKRNCGEKKSHLFQILNETFQIHLQTKNLLRFCKAGGLWESVSMRTGAAVFK